MVAPSVLEISRLSENGRSGAAAYCLDRGPPFLSISTLSVLKAAQLERTAHANCLCFPPAPSVTGFKSAMQLGLLHR